MRSQIATALVGLVASLAISVLAWWYLGTLLFFLFVPFVPFLFSRRGGTPVEREIRTCPRCEFRTERNDYEFCPRDGARLQRDDLENDRW